MYLGGRDMMQSWNRVKTNLVLSQRWRHRRKFLTGKRKGKKFARALRPGHLHNGKKKVLDEKKKKSESWLLLLSIYSIFRLSVSLPIYFFYLQVDLSFYIYTNLMIMSTIWILTSVDFFAPNTEMIVSISKSLLKYRVTKIVFYIFTDVELKSLIDSFYWTV